MWEYVATNFSCLGDPNNGGRFRFFSQLVTKIPIPKVNIEEKLEIISLVKNCLDLKGINCKMFETEIDIKVKKLYGL